MEGNLKLPSTSLSADHHERPLRRKQSLRLLVGIVIALFLAHASFQTFQYVSQPVKVPLHASKTLNKCRALNTKPGPPPDFNLRKASDRYVKGTRATLLRNATIWTGNVDGLEVITGDLLLDRGLIKAVGHIGPQLLKSYKHAVIVDLDGAWVTPGSVSILVRHTSALILITALLTSTRIWGSIRRPHCMAQTTPTLLRALHNLGLGPSMESTLMTKRTSCQSPAELRPLSFFLVDLASNLNLLPLTNALRICQRYRYVGSIGSSRLILTLRMSGGQAFPIKLRPTDERSPISMLLEPPHSLNGSDVDPAIPPRWRQMKHVLR